MPRPRTPRAAKSAETAKSTEAVKSETAKTTEFVCPECGRTFTRAASLGAHRRQSHEIPGATRAATQPKNTGATTPSAKTVRRRRARTRRTTVPAASTASIGTTDRDALLRTLFPNGIPARESVIRSINTWLDEADRLARLR